MGPELPMGMPAGGDTGPGSGVPTQTGQLLVGQGAALCPVDVQPGDATSGAQQSSGDMGQPGTPATPTSVNVLTHSDTPSFGTSPLTHAYTIDLSLVPAGARITRATVGYLIVSGTEISITDPGGTTTGTSLEWNPAGIASLNADLGNSLHSVSAVFTFTGGSGGFRDSTFTVFYQTVSPG